MPPKPSIPRAPTEGERLLARLQQIAPGVEWAPSEQQRDYGQGKRPLSYIAVIGETTIKASWNRLAVKRPGHHEDRQVSDDAFTIRLLRAIAVARGQDEVTIAYVLDARTGARKAIYEVTS